MILKEQVFYRDKNIILNEPLAWASLAMLMMWLEPKINDMLAEFIQAAFLCCLIYCL